MEQETQNQHVVPQVHLKSFLGKDKKKLSCLNINKLRIEKDQSPSRICSGRFHYAEIPGLSDEYGQEAEIAFGVIEDWYGKNKGKIEEKLINKERLTDGEKYDLSFLISNFLFRGYSHREDTLHFSKKMLDEITDGLDKDVTINGISQEDAYKEVEKTSYATNQAFRDGLANALTHKKWEVLINLNEKYKFITSDEPVIQYVPDFAKKWPMFSTSYVVMTQLFHLSPKVAIVATFQPNHEGEWDFIDVTNKVDKIFESNLKYINYSYKYAYADSDHFFQKLIDFESKKRNQDTQ
jgi:hypothetical protein